MFYRRWEWYVFASVKRVDKNDIKDMTALSNGVLDDFKDAAK